MKDNKDLDREKLEAEDVKIVYETENPFLKKLSNFWYYHKWKVIIIAFFAIIFAVGISQMITREKIDEAVIVAAPVYLDSEQREGIDSLLTSLLPKNKDGSLRTLDVRKYVVYSEEEIEEANRTETNEEGRYIEQIDRSLIMEEIQSFNDDLSTGECSVLFVCPYLYEELSKRQVSGDRDIRLTMTEIFGDEFPEGVMPDGCGVRLGDTELYKYYEELQVLPEDTVVCVLRSYYMGASSNKEKHAMSVELFKSIVTFGSEN